MFVRWLIVFMLIAAAVWAVRRERPSMGTPWQTASLPIADTRDAGSALRSLDATAATRPSRAWLDDFATFSSNHPGTWIVGRCHEPCLSEAEAQQSARADAADAVCALLSPRLAAVGGAGSLGRLTAGIQAGQLQVDCLTERFDRPYGTVWSASVLLDASPQRLGPLLASSERVWRELQNRAILMHIAALAFVAAVGLMYIFLNAVTKGYFTTRLRLVAVTFAAAVIIILFV